VEHEILGPIVIHHEGDGRALVAALVFAQHGVFFVIHGLLRWYLPFVEVSVFLVANRSERAIYGLSPGARADRDGVTHAPAAGSAITNVAPRPDLLSTRMLPPCSRII